MKTLKKFSLNFKNGIFFRNEKLLPLDRKFPGIMYIILLCFVFLFQTYEFKELSWRYYCFIPLQIMLILIPLLFKSVQILVLQILAISSLLLPKLLLVTKVLIDTPYLYPLGMVTDLLLISLINKFIFEREAGKYYNRYCHSHFH